MGHISYGAIVVRGKILAGLLNIERNNLGFRYGLWVGQSEHGSPSMSFDFLPDFKDNSLFGNITPVPLAALRISANERSQLSGEEIWLILRPTQSVEGEYARIGIIRQPWGRGTAGKSLQILDNLRARFAEEAVERNVKII